MSNNSNNLSDGYRATITNGLEGMQYFRMGFSDGEAGNAGLYKELKQAIDDADAIVIGGGAGLSAAAGLTYSGARFQRYFFDFAEVYGIHDMYAGGFYPFPDAETRWAWWSRHIYFNRYVFPPKPVYQDLLALLQDKDYFVITTNVDHQFQLAGFDKRRIFYTQGDYGLFQSTNPENHHTYDNEAWVMAAMAYQGFVKDETGVYQVPVGNTLKMRLSSALVPVCPDGSAATMNLRADDSFVEDAGWHQASQAYADFLRRHQGMRVLFFELGVGGNTPVIIKYPFWQMTMSNLQATYACVNNGEAHCPVEIEERAVCINGDIAEILHELIKGAY